MLRCKQILAAFVIVAACGSAGAKKKPVAKPVHKPAPHATPVVAPPVPSPAPEPMTPPPTAPREEPPPPPPPKEEPPPPPKAPDRAQIDLDALTAEYNALRDELFRSRAKVDLVGSALYKTRLVALFEYKAQRAWPIKKVTLRLDDQPVNATDSPSTNDPLKLYEGFVAPGRHTLQVHVECSGGGGESYAADGTFVIEAVADKQTRVELSVDESGDGPQSLAKKKRGSFDVRVRADIDQRELGAK